MSAPIKVTFPSFMLQISGELYEPVAGSPDRKGAAAVVSHPMTGVKEPTSANHARLLSKALVTPSHSTQEDVKAAVSYLTTLEGKVDPGRIGILGICASGGYTSYAAQSDSRVKGLATVGAACGEQQGVPPGYCWGSPGGWIMAHAGGSPTSFGGPTMFGSDINQIPDNADSFFKDAAAYYGSERGRHPRSDQRVPPSSYDLMVCYDSFNFQQLISGRPLLMVAGSKTQTLHYSATAVAAAC
ncbi:hypothetical protein CNMCM8927_009010 [Aspergillus lentulus]|uniref:Dienelactone hydrolase domain-containing protein n=1 Tax=Aspergillus lentulus TaxID=293939 RepID=A0AAN5YN18_ASPLE|nr:hypothetical protein CNMCM8060_008467 [Aspergillus lentulus]KAF4182989.1 hypothetical protein CNMCM7927_009366 [Aspergillus lentulus]KAF4193541.1 hypothetical protein CNMCM8694_008796 [Aspergillus lentulus]KAF4203248.1 hypothetical protein CNMCM8927_009010 [Aspergillus lentulus]GFF80987.1 hypothetical protein IFM60648_05890 [Aspergillus lentulus]